MLEEGFNKNPWYNDTFFLKFCRARKFDIEKIKIMFTNYIEYRKEYGIDDIITVSKYSEYNISDIVFMWVLEIQV